MTTRLILEEQAGKIRVALQRADNLTAEPYGQFTDFAFPIEAAELEDLRWYLEDYLPAPYAVWEEKGQQVQEHLQVWGTRLFETIFEHGQPFRDAYIAAKAKGDFQIWISSDSAGFLGLPWELLYDPEEKNFITLSCGGIHRTLPAKVESEAVRHADRLRVLMVIARPGGEQDVPYQMIAKQLLQRIDLVSGKVELDVLRPPTIQALKQKIAQAAKDGNPYDVLHFDGHGSFGNAPATGRPLSSHHYQAPEGYLVFEKENGQSDPISADQFSTEMQKANIPLFVFNACKSGQLTAAGGPEAAVVTRLIQQGAAAAVAMGYSVYAVAAAEFMAMFYEALFAGRSVAEAVQEGRRQMRLKNQRPSPKGAMPLDDWLVPVHYARKEIRFPQLESAAKADTHSLADTLSKLQETRVADTESCQASEQLRPQGRFLGRDAELYNLERAFGRNGVVIAHGVGGSGKTELAKAFARWLQASGGLDDPRLVFMDVFEPGLASFGLPQVLSSFGLNIMGPDFVRKFPSLPEQQHVVLKVLADHRILWIWDNFETVCSLAGHNNNCVLDQAALSQMKEFLRKVQDQAAVGILITSRSSEPWLGTDPVPLEVGGLNPQDAALYADDLLAARPKAQEKRNARPFGDLMDFLGGHPLSMRLILPHLERVDAQTLLKGLKGQGELPPGFEGGKGRLESLGASVHYSFRHLPEKVRQRLPVLSLFEGVVDVGILALLSGQDNLPDFLRGVTKEDWETTLSQCCDTGLLTPIGSGIYQMHPALPGYLSALWKTAAGGRFQGQYEQVLVATIDAHAKLGAWLSKQINAGRAETAMAVLFLEKPTLLRMLQEAMSRKLYSQAQAILQPVNELWNARGLYVEARGWVERLQDVLESKAGAAPEIESAAGALWLFAVGSQANRSNRAGDLDAAEKIYDDIRKTLERSESKTSKRHLATAYHQLGMVAQDRGDLAAAETWYKKSLEIKESIGNRPGMASSYHQLGIVAQDRGDLAVAETWYKKSLEIDETLGNRPGMATAYGQLGLLAEKRGDRSEALDWMVRCICLFEKFPHPLTGPGPDHLKRLTKELGMKILEERWKTITGNLLPDQVRRFIEENEH